MSWWLTKLIQQLDRIVYVAGAMVFFVLMYLWSVLSRRVSPHEGGTITVPTEALFSFAEHSVYQFSGGLVAHVQNGALGYVFSTQELIGLTALAFVSQCLLSAVVLVALIALKHRAVRRYALVMVVLSALLLMSPLYALYDVDVIRPWLSMYLIGLPLLGVYVATKRHNNRRTDRPALIAYASQTGSAKRLAEQLHDAAQSLMDVRCISQLSAQQLLAYQNVFFVVSTHGNGQAPDSAHKFLSDMEKHDATKIETQFSVLALGDRTYKTFCAFGYQLTDLLRQKGLKPVLPIQAVDRMDVSAVDHWWQQVCGVLGIGSDVVEMQYEHATLQVNECLNPAQSHRHAHRLTLSLPGARYRAGDLLAVQPDGLKEPERLYSIASCSDDSVELLVRRHIREDGTVGVASGMLTALKPGDRIKASIREHESFHLCHDVPLIMIAAGTGLAPFVGFLKQKQRWASQTPNWLFFGEQYAEQDAYFASDLDELASAGVLTRLDLAWSRTDGVYVPARLIERQAALLEWIHKGAHIYVCGSRTGFGEAVCSTLHSLLPAPLIRERLHTDLY